MAFLDFLLKEGMLGRLLFLMFKSLQIVLHLSHPRWVILHLGEGETVQKHAFTFCSFRLTQFNGIIF
jgi:hypothetical protein